MEFGKLHSLEGVNFDLPPDANGTQQLLARNTIKESVSKIFVGCTGWGMPQWVGDVYPMRAKPKDFLRHYAQQFNTIELNTTHYRIPNTETIRTWFRETTDDFKFCPKIPQTISHSRDLGVFSNQITDFCRAVGGLEHKMGCCFMQVPPHFAPKHLGVLENFLLHFSSHIPLAVEVRHEDFFNNPSHFDRYFDLLERYGITSVITDVAGRRDVLHQRLTTTTAMIRFVGNDLHPSDYTRINAWTERLSDWFSSGLEQLYFFTHEPDNLRAPILAHDLIEKLQKKPTFTTTLRPPVFFSEPKQMELF
jgi:uncharacterized protein YecE (DUF72 family)